MDRFDPVDLKDGDIILLEAFVVRWPLQDQPKKENMDSDDERKLKAERYKKRREWKKWAVDLRLDAVSILFQGSEHQVEASKPDEDVNI